MKSQGWSLPEALLAVIVLGGCNQWNLPPPVPMKPVSETGARIHGVLKDATGAALAGVPVAVCKTGPGTSCDPASSVPFVQGVTDDSGAFALEVTGEQATVEGDLGAILPANFSVGLPTFAGQAQSLLSFPVTQADIELPTLQAWNPRVDQVDSAGDLLLTWQRLADVSASQPVSELAVTEVPARVFSSHQQLLTAQSREDFDVTLQLLSSRAMASTSMSIDERHQLTVPLRKGTLVASSRGAACTIGGQPQVRCPLTDGKLDALLSVPGVSEVVVNLPAAKPLRRVLLRSLSVLHPYSSARITVDVSNDGTTWEAISSEVLEMNHDGPSFDGPDGIVVADSITSVSMIRVRVVGIERLHDVTIGSLAEISAFE